MRNEQKQQWKFLNWFRLSAISNELAVLLTECNLNHYQLSRAIMWAEEINKLKTHFSHFSWNEFRRHVFTSRRRGGKRVKIQLNSLSPICLWKCLVKMLIFFIWRALNIVSCNFSKKTFPLSLFPFNLWDASISFLRTHQRDWICWDHRAIDMSIWSVCDGLISH